MTLAAAQRYALIAQIVRDYNVSGLVAGKKAVQKLFYILQQRQKEAKNYGFSFYNYGVYSHDLARDVGDAERYDFIDVKYDERANTFAIKPSVNFESNTQFIPAFYNSSIFSDVVGKSAKELELITTIMFVCDEEKNTEEQKIIDRVHELKPKFSKREIKQHILPEYCGCMTR